MSKKNALTIVALFLMVAASSTAYGYGETWDGWFSGGTLYYGGNTYTYVMGNGSANDTTNTLGTLDLFYTTGPSFCIPFANTSGNDTILLGVSSISGSKTTGQSGTKNGTGNWSGSGVRRQGMTIFTTFTSISGTWSATFSYINCPPNKPTYTGSWLVTSSTPSGLTGGGNMSGQKTAAW